MIRENFSKKKILYGSISLLFIANTINIVTDLGAMGSSAQLVLRLPSGYGLWAKQHSFYSGNIRSYKTYAKYFNIWAVASGLCGNGFIVSRTGIAISDFHVYSEDHLE